MKVNWRRVRFIALLWLFVVDGPGACQALWPERCNPHVLATCEP
jgi:hypothetical protein